MRKLLIVDGSNLLFQMFFGMPARIYNDQGVGIWGVLGFVGALLKMIRKTAPTHVAVLFDGEHDNPRAALDSTYKANREDLSDAPDQENPFSQLPYIYRALDFLKITHAETMDCETDDWIASYAACCGDKDQLVIASMDSDFFQLIRENISVLRYRGEQSVLCTPEYIREKFGVEPEQYADLKTLTGDPADNIRGAHKVGVKTAAWLLQQFGCLEQVVTQAADISKSAVRSAVMESGTRLLRNYRLIKLEGTHPVPFPIEQLTFHDTGIKTTQVLQGIGLK